MFTMAHVPQYFCKSTDTKPTTNIGYNELLMELDTGDFYYFDTDNTWKKVGAGA